MALLLGMLLAMAAGWWLIYKPTSANFAATLTDQITTTSTVFISIFIEAVPFLTLGTLASGLVEVFVRHEDIARLLPRDPVRGAVFGALMGLCFPVCDCGVVPLTRRFLRKGVPVPVCMSFLLAAPLFNPIAIASTAVAFGVGPILFGRIVLTLVVAIATGVIFSTQKHPEKLLLSVAWAPMAGGSGAMATSPTRPTWRQGLPQALAIAVDEFFEMGRYLMIGTVLASVLQTVVPQSALLTVSAGPVVSVITLITLAVVLSICSTVDAFVALAFARTFTSGSLLAFLVFGPMVDVKNTLMFLSVFRRRTVIYLILLPLFMIVLVCVFINFNVSW
jgi:uncharacterized membrane protein YraQ (UPF0718 family)